MSAETEAALRDLQAPPDAAVGGYVSVSEWEQWERKRAEGQHWLALRIASAAPVASEPPDGRSSAAAVAAGIRWITENLQDDVASHARVHPVTPEAEAAPTPQPEEGA